MVSCTLPKGKCENTEPQSLKWLCLRSQSYVASTKDPGIPGVLVATAFSARSRKQQNVLLRMTAHVSSNREAFLPWILRLKQLAAPNFTWPWMIKRSEVIRKQSLTFREWTEMLSTMLTLTNWIYFTSQFSFCRSSNPKILSAFTIYNSCSVRNILGLYNFGK